MVKAQQEFKSRYPVLTEDQIALEAVAYGVETWEIPILQRFYGTTSYTTVSRELGFARSIVRQVVLRSLERLSEASSLHAALLMAYENLNILKA